MFRRLTTLATAIVTALALAVAPAIAASRYSYRESGVAAQTDWIQVDGIAPGTHPLGNVHVGFLYVYQTSKGVADAFGYIEDFDCEPGELPDGGGHGFEEEPSGCVWVGARNAEGFGLSFTVDKKMTKAVLTGQLKVYGGGHGGGPVLGRPQANITWNGYGPLMKQRSTWQYNDGSTIETGRYRSTDRLAEMTGNIGPMGFDPDLSGGFISRFTQSGSSRTK